MANYILKKFLIPVIRRASYKWPARNEALKEARIERGLYKCNSCGGIFKKKFIQIDHINPVISVEKGFNTWDEYLERMFCSKEGFQIICVDCHDIKTAKEKEMRKMYKIIDKKSKLE